MMYLLLFEGVDNDTWSEEFVTALGVVKRIAGLAGAEGTGSCHLIVGEGVPITPLMEFYERQSEKLAGTLEAQVTKLLGAPPAILPQADVPPPAMDLQRIEWAIKELESLQAARDGADATEDDCDLIAALDEIRAELSRLLP